MVKRLEQQKEKIRKLEQKLKEWKVNAETWKFYYRRSQEEVHRLHQIIKKLEKQEEIKKKVTCPHIIKDKIENDRKN